MPAVTAKDFGGVANALVKLVHEKSRQKVYNIWYNLVELTPVCSGKAAASWRASPNIPKTADKLASIPFKGECVRVYDDPRKLYDSPTALLGQYNKNYSKWFITNSTDYITKLNEGYSQKAPAGFIDIAVKRGLID